MRIYLFVSVFKVLSKSAIANRARSSRKEICRAMGSDQATKFVEWENNDDIKIFREYLKIPSVHPNVNYGKTMLLKNSIDKIKP